MKVTDNAYLPGSIAGSFYIYFLPSHLFSSCKGYQCNFFKRKNYPIVLTLRESFKRSLVDPDLFKSDVANICLALTQIMMGVTIGAIGLFSPLLFIGSILTTVAGSVLTTLQTHSGSSVWIGYQAIAGIELGLCLKTPISVTQRISKPDDIAPATAIVLCKLQGFSRPV